MPSQRCYCFLFIGLKMKHSLELFFVQAAAKSPTVNKLHGLNKTGCLLVHNSLYFHVGASTCSKH